MQYVTCLRCTSCGRPYRPEPTRYLCGNCGEEGLLEVEYDYGRMKRDWQRESLQNAGERSMWRYLPLLPVLPGLARPALRVGMTPVYESRPLAEEIGLAKVFVKDDGLNPTGSLKDRASALAVAKALEAGARTVACSSTGNAATSLAGNTASLGGGMQSVIFIPERAPAGKVAQLLIYGALVVMVRGSYQEAYHLSRQAIEHWGWYNRNAAVNPYLVEGKKTVVLELAEQLSWQLPDWLAFSVGDGCTIAGAWKGLSDLEKLGFITRMPKLLGVQAEGCAPVTRAFHSGGELVPEDEDTLADSIAVGEPRNYQKAIQGVELSRGEMINVSDGDILQAMRLLGRKTGVFAEPAAAAGLAGLIRLARSGGIGPGETAAVIITGNGLKDSKNARKATGEPLMVDPDLNQLAELFQEMNMPG